MKFTLSWLKEHLDTDEPLEKLADKLTMIGLEVENIEDKAKALAPFSIARVISAEQHPNADRLRVCMVDTGDGGAPVQVVCGAPNARAGLVSVFSPPGTFIPGKNITLGVGTIRGVESRGMLCSAAELQISEDHDGIMELPADAPIGKGYAEWAGLGDPVLEINLTPNRQDCTGVHGIARDLSAADMGKFKDPAIKPIKGEFPCPVKVTVEDATLCPGFALRLVRGVKNGPSPEWLQKRLTVDRVAPDQRAGRHHQLHDLRPRPAAARVRRQEGERQSHRAPRQATARRLLALDGRTYTLDPAICVIADEHGVESLAGIMGGETSGCDENTTDVLIESALWNEINIAQTGRKLGINSDARYRFERGVDPAFMVPGLELATKLVMELCGGTPSENVVVGNAFGEDRIIDFPLSEVKRLAGIEVPLVEMRRILSHLGFMVAGSGPVVKVAVPSWRTDVHGKADIVEEIVRIVGVDKVPMTPFERGDDAAQAGADRDPAPHPPRQARAGGARHGGSRDLVVHLQTAGRIVRRRTGRARARQPDRLRPLRHAAEPVAGPRRRGAGQRQSRLIRTSRCSRSGRSSGATGPRTSSSRPPACATALRPSKGMGRHWSGSAMTDALDAKADAFAVLAAAGAPMQALQIVPGGASWLHPGRSGTIQIGPQNVLGYFGELHPRTLEALGADGPLIAFEVILDRIPDAKKKPTRAKPVLDLSAFQPVSRDFAFIVDRGVKAGDIVRSAQGVDKKLITDVTVFDVYEGKGIDPDKKSIAIAVTIQPREKTLTDQEIDAVAAKIVAEVTKKTGGTLRA